jgi:hypothetical protein
MAVHIFHAFTIDNDPSLMTAHTLVALAFVGELQAVRITYLNVKVERSQK